MKPKYLIAFLFINLTLFACKEDNKKTVEEALPILKKLDPKKDITYLCYSHILKNGTKADTTQLLLKIDKDNKVKGKFKWIPAEKDALNGNLEGAKNGNTIKAAFTFTQEGTIGTAPIQIDFTGDNAKITIKREQAPLTFNTTKGSCN